METANTNAMRNAWLWLIGLPVAYVAVTLIGGAISAALDVAEGELIPTAWVPVILLIGVVLFAIPTFMAYSNGRKAQSHGASNPLLPFWIALVATVLFVVVNLFAFFTG